MNETRTSCAARLGLLGLLAVLPLLTLSCTREPSEQLKANSEQKKSAATGEANRGASPVQPAVELTPAKPLDADDAQDLVEIGTSEADKAWRAFQKASQPPPPPEAWEKSRPSPDDISKFDLLRSTVAAEAADKAKDFYTRFADHPHAAEARKSELDLNRIAVELGNTNRLARLEHLELEQLKDPSLTEDQRLQIRLSAVQRAAMLREAEGPAGQLAEFEKGARALLKEFPKREELYEILMEVAANSEGEKARTLAQEIVTGAPSETLKESAKAMLKKLDALGKPVAIKFKAIDGREVDVAKLAGKVVLVDFWATWCGPCVAALPEVKAAYEKLHAKGFEIVGISLDEKKEKLQSFAADNKILWPQFFDDSGGDNKIALEFGITTIPAMYLVDKKGVLRDMNARADLAGKVEKLLAE